MNWKKLFYFGLVGFVFTGVAMGAPKWAKWVNVMGPGPFKQVRPVQLSYDFSWNGMINAATATIVFGKPDARQPQHFIGQAHGKTIGIARSFYKTDFNYYAYLDPKTYRPRAFIADEKTKKFKRKTTTRYTSEQVLVDEEESRPVGARPRKETVRFSHSNVYDLMSAVMTMRSLDLKPGKTATLVTMPFKSPYLVRVTHMGYERHNGFRASKLGLRLHKIDRNSLELLPYKKMKKATLWLSADAERLPLELRSEVFIGDVRAVLKSKKYL